MPKNADITDTNNSAEIPVTDEKTSDLTALRKDVDALREDIRKLFSDTSRYVRGKADEGVESGRNLADRASSEANDARDYAESRIRENPLTAVGVAFGAGLVLAMLRRK